MIDIIFRALTLVAWFAYISLPPFTQKRWVRMLRVILAGWIGFSLAWSLSSAILL